MGGRYLKDFGLSTFADIEQCIGDVLLKIAEDVRYLEPMREGENIIRARLHPLWLAVHEVLKRDLTEHRSGIVPGRIIEFAREQKRQQCIDNIAGNAATLAVVDGLCSDVAQRALPGKVAAALHKRFDADPGRLAQKMDRVANQYRFIV